MRLLLTILISATLVSAKAQSHLPITPYPLHDSGKLNYKWQLKPYASLSAGYVFLNGGISYLSAPVGLMLFRPLNNNVTAFAGLSAAPTVFSFNRLYTYPAQTPSYPGNGFSNRYNLGLNARVEGGLIYTNDAKTFSISGSFGVERGSYPVYPVYRANTKKQ
ncbi:hypothetical protein Q4E93_34005 [Flavitalea sp. BT771]|uniref:hypothetical protein n=1 Tax=Flavitalea sp. BT771 TaxID=3063329 RepID=UPI0026E38A8A|nr:hypothetical protein [Flavitalea sp. BT771]MDO6435678.1 hypothetical protein [Flavitalea sp. BT771]MDV6224579.1 hypothetical protein [Flavitalea sp. BT771]